VAFHRAQLFLSECVMVLCRRLPVLVGLVVLSLAGALPTAAFGQGGDDPFASLLDKPAPAIETEATVNDKTNKVKKLADLKGKVVLVSFMQPWSTPCVNCLDEWVRWKKELNIKGLTVVGVTVYGGDSRRLDLDNTGRLFTVAAGTTPRKTEERLLQEFADNSKLNFPILVLSPAAWEKALEAYKIKAVPTMVLLDREGKVREVRVGGDPGSIQAMGRALDRVIKENK